MGRAASIVREGPELAPGSLYVDEGGSRASVVKETSHGSLLVVKVEEGPRSPAGQTPPDLGKTREQMLPSAPRGNAVLPTPGFYPVRSV